MRQFIVSARVTFDVAIRIEAESAAAALAIFERRAMMTVGFADADDIVFEVEEDSISEMDIEDVEEVK